MESYSEIDAKYSAYVDAFRDAKGELSAMMELKRLHTARVVENARLIAEGESFASNLRERALIASLLHDTGRYERIRQYNTFRDSDSIDHAVLSYDIVKSQGWVEDEGILLAIRYHNVRDLPEDLDEETSLIAKTVRDADKLDIFRVLEELTATSDWRENRDAFWNLDIDKGPNPKVIEAIIARRPVDYQNICSLADFVLIQIGWIISGLYFATSRRICLERGHFDYRMHFLHEICPNESFAKIEAMMH